MHAKLLATDCSEEQVLKYTDRFLMSLSLGSFLPVQRQVLHLHSKAPATHGAVVG